jgi:uncharacterized protein
MPSSDKTVYSKYDLNFFREKKMGEKILLVTFLGTFDFLTQGEYRNLKGKRLDSEHYKRFLENGLIVNAENRDRIVEVYRKKKEQLFQGTSLHIVVVTLRCNEHCIYCHAASKAQDAKDYDMDIATARKTVDFIFQSPSKVITIEFQGGEPLLNFEVVREIVTYAKEKNKAAGKELSFSIVTNLSLMDDAKLDFFISNKVGICTSLDGPKYLHDKNRPMAGGSSYDQTVKWIKRIKEKGYDCTALVSVTRYSLPYAKEIVDEYVKLKLKNVWFRSLNRLGCAATAWDKISFSAEDYIKFWKAGVDYAYAQEGITELSSSIILMKMLTDSDPLFLDLMSPCGAGIGQLAYNYDGNIYSCDEARMTQEEMFRLGNVAANTYKDVLTSPKCCNLVAASVNECYYCDNCIYQPYCGLCPVATFATTGNIVPNMPHEDRCKILTAQFEHLFDKIATEPGFIEKVRKRIEAKEKAGKERNG